MRLFWGLAASWAMAGRLAAGGLALAMATGTTGCVVEEVSDDDDDDDDEDDDDDGGGLSPGGGNGSRQGQSCTGEEVSCAGADTIDVCESGTFQSYSCGEACSYAGFGSNGCGRDMCQCGEPTNAQCANGVIGFCACIEWAGAGACTDNELSGWYTACHQGDPELNPMMMCFSNYVSNGSIDCVAAAEACQPG